MKLHIPVLFLGITIGVLACENNYGHHADSGSGDKMVKMEDSANFTEIQWIDSAKNLGQINEGEKIEVNFRFRNTGNKPLIIARVDPSCGCTAAEPPKEPIAPGAEGVIKGIFDSHNKLGPAIKTLNVFANTRPMQHHVLSFSVEVKAKPGN